MNRSIFDIQADFCEAMANRTRLQIMHVLREQAMRVADIAQTTNLSQSVVSRQLGILRNTGVVDCRRQGNEMIYHLTDENIGKLCDLVRKLLSDQAQRQSQVFENHLA
jgi:DNA-binding transcriptional ArsR family regulator